MKKLLLLSSACSILILASCGGDSAEDPQLDCNSSDLDVTITATIDADCSVDGNLMASGSGGAGGFEYSIDGSSFQSSGSFDLSAGNYTVTVRDAEGCTSTVQATIGAAANTVSISSVQSTNSDCLTDNGTIDVTAAGGTAPLMYKLDDGSFQSSSSFTDVSPGSHTITVQDDNGCEATREESISTSTSLVNDIMPLLAANCFGSSCHNGNNGASRDWRDKTNVINSATSIKTRTQNGSMPIGGTLSQDNKDLIACWVDDGAMDN